MITNPSAVKVTQPNAVKVALFYVCLYTLGTATPFRELSIPKPAPDADGRFTLAIAAWLQGLAPFQQNAEYQLGVYGVSPTGKKSASVFATQTLFAGTPPPVDDTPDPPSLVELQA
jgi:hypothetical protein